MDVSVDQSRKHQGVADVERLGGIGRGLRRVNHSRDPPVEDPQSSVAKDAIGQHHIPADDEVHRDHHRLAANSSTTRSIRSAPAAMSSGSALSPGAWESPSRHGTKSIPEGASAAT